MRRASVVFCLWLTAVWASSAQERTGPTVPLVRAHGEATVDAPPDQVRIDIGVVTQAQTAQAAAAQNARQLSDVMAELKKTLGAGAEIKTVNYSVQPNYRHNRDGSPPVITGYTANNSVQVKMGDVAAAGKIIDAATRTGANNIQGINFTVKDEQRVRAQALGAAAKQARANADAMATALGLRVVRVVSVDDGQPISVHPVQREMLMAMSKAADAPTPVEPGTVQVRATVTVTVEVAP